MNATESSTLPPDIEELSSVDGPAVLALSVLLAEAFEFDPALVWLFPDDRVRRARLRKLYELDVRHRLATHTRIFVAADGGGVAFWSRGAPQRTGRTGLRIAPAFASLVGRRAHRAFRLWRDLERRTPTEPHWHLSHLAVSARHRGRGTGRALLEAGLRLADVDGAGAFVHTANDGCLEFFESAEFRQVGLLARSHCPPVWQLWRNPR